MFSQSSRAALLLSLCASCAHAAFVPPSRLDVPVILSSGGRPMLGVTMGTTGVGSIQNFNFTLSTSTGYTAVANNGCADCGTEATYDQAKSPNAHALNGQSVLSLGAGTFSGGLVKENCTLATTQKGTSWPYTNQTIVLMDQQSGTTAFGNEISGLFGLGTLKQGSTSSGFNASFDDSIYGQYYIRNPSATASGYNFTFGMDLKPSPVIPGSGSALSIQPGQETLAQQQANVGTIHWLQPDTSAFQADKMQKVTVMTGITSGYLANNSQPDLTVPLDGWSVKVGNSNAAVSNILANIDPYYSGIYMPATQARTLHDLITGSVNVQLSTLAGQTTSWQVPCDTSLEFTVTINGQQFTVDSSTLVASLGNGTCVSIIEGFKDTSVTQYIFGQTWISQLYVIFNIPQNGDPELAFAPRSVSSSHSRDIGAIVGGVVGGVAGVIALGLLGFYLIRRRQDNSFFARAAALEEEHKVASTVEPYTLGSGPTPAQPSPPAHAYGFGAYVTPPVSPHMPLLEHDAAHGAAPPTYEEASEVGGSSSSGAAAAAALAGAGRNYPPEKEGYGMRRDTAFSGYTEPASPNQQSTYSGSAANNV